MSIEMEKRVALTRSPSYHRELRMIKSDIDDTVDHLDYTRDMELSDVTIQFDEDIAQARLTNLLVLKPEDLEIKEENPFVEFTVFCQNWFMRALKLERRPDSVEKVAEVIEHIFDVVEEEGYEPSDLVEIKTIETATTVEIRGKVKSVDRVSKRTMRLVKGNRTMFAATLANVARVKFGPVRMNEANFIMIRRWLHNYVEEEFADLRNADKANALDRATFLAMMTSSAFEEMKAVFGTKRMQDRVLLRFGEVA